MQRSNRLRIFPLDPRGIITGIRAWYDGALTRPATRPATRWMATVDLDLKRAKAGGLGAKVSKGRALMSWIRFLMADALVRLKPGSGGAAAPHER